MQAPMHDIVWMAIVTMHELFQCGSGIKLDEMHEGTFNNDPRNNPCKITVILHGVYAGAKNVPMARLTF
jgi:hypothetical protein